MSKTRKRKTSTPRMSLEQKIITRLTENPSLTRKKLRDKVGGTNVPLAAFNKLIGKLKRNRIIEQKKIRSDKGRPAESFNLITPSANGNDNDTNTPAKNVRPPRLSMLNDTMAAKIRAVIHTLESQGQFNQTTRLKDVIAGLGKHGVTEKDITPGTWSHASRMLKAAKAQLTTFGSFDAAMKMQMQMQQKKISSPTPIIGLDRIDGFVRFIKFCGSFDAAMKTLDAVQNHLGIEMNESRQAIATIALLVSE